MMMDDFDDWYGELRPRLTVALAAWCGDTAIAVDATDEAFVRALERWDRVRRLDSPAGWVWRTAANLVRRTMRRQRLEARALRRHAAGRSTSLAGPVPDDLDLVAALGHLTDRQRTAIVLHYVADLPHAEVAVMLGVATGTVAATLHQSRVRLAGLLTEQHEVLADPSPLPRTDGASR